MSLTRVIEALLFSAQKPLSIREIATAVKGAADDPAGAGANEFSRVREPEIAAALEQLKIDYIEHERAFQLMEKAEGWQLVTDPQYFQWVRQLFPAPKPARLSAPALETLAIIAYRQPIARADVEAVRGVNIDGVLQTLMERGLVKIAGRAEIPGRPLIYETTQFFLDHFGLRSLEELPNVEELRKRNLPAARVPVAGSDDANAPGRRVGDVIHAWIIRHGCAPHSEAATAGCFFSRLGRYHLRLQKSDHRIARVQQRTQRTTAAFPCWWCKMAEQFLSITLIGQRQAQDGRSLVEPKVFGVSPR